MKIETTYEEVLKELYDLGNLFNLENEDISLSHSLEEKDGNLFNYVKIQNGKVLEERFCVQMLDTLSNVERKRFIKRQAKLSVYSVLARFLQKDLPWGSLTGIRPTKVAYDLLEQGVKPHLLKETLMQTFKLSESKASLTNQIVKNQNCIIRNDNLVDLYINIPICPTRCSYCTFISSDFNHAKNLIPAYIDALKKEIKAVKEIINNKSYVVRTIYMGGGTPSVLTASELDEILNEVSYPVCEITVECGRADTITEEKLLVLKSHNVSRISINPQTFCKATLKRIGRCHKNEEIIESYKLAMKHGFDVNMDLIAGLPGENFATFKKTLSTTLELYPENITVHTLSLKKGSELKGEFEGDDKLAEKMVSYAEDVLMEGGYKPYYLYRQKNQLSGLENVGYFRDGKICIFNVDSMEETLSVLAVGANAISKRIYNLEGRIERCANVKFIEDYISRIDEMIERKRELFR